MNVPSAGVVKMRALILFIQMPEAPLSLIRENRK